MRKLLYVPIIHTSSDLGSLGPALEGASAAQVGESRWARHRETVAGFWKAIEGFLAAINAQDLRIYQDGLAAEGELGRRVVEEAAKRGSLNYRILLDLMHRGAELRKTEAVSLLLEEGWQLLLAAADGPAPTQGPGGEGYQGRKEDLTEQRDRFVAERINETLTEGETGILFMGAYHDVLPHLARDILVQPVKEQRTVKAYFQELMAGGDQARLKELARYLTCRPDAMV